MKICGWEIKVRPLDRVSRLTNKNVRHAIKLVFQVKAVNFLGKNVVFEGT